MYHLVVIEVIVDTPLDTLFISIFLGYVKRTTISLH